MVYHVAPAKQSNHIDFSMMGGLVDMLTQISTQIGGPTGGRQVVDMTGVQGNYDATIEISILDILAMAKNAGVDFGVNLPNAGGAADPGGGGTSMMDAVKSMGLKLESRKAPVDQFVIDHLEKTPTEN